MARAVTVGPVPPGLARIDWSSSSSQRRTTLSPLLGASPLIVYRGGGKSGSGGPAVCARTAPPKLAMSTAATTTAVSPRLDRTRMHPPETRPRPPHHGGGTYPTPPNAQSRAVDGREHTQNRSATLPLREAEHRAVAVPHARGRAAASGSTPPGGERRRGAVRRARHRL